MRPGRRGSGAPCVIAAAWLAIVAPSSSPAAPPAYGVLVEQYRTGDADAAVAALIAWNSARLAREARPARLPGDAAMRAAAIALHTEVAIRETSTPRAPVHLEIARSGVAGLAASPDTQPFRRAWYVLTIDYLIHWAALTRAGTIVDQIPRDVADAPETHVAVGLYHETLADSAATARVAVRERTTAARHYRAAVSGSPSLVEARLRLGRVLLLLDRADEALAELERVSAETPDPTVNYLARLFLGQAHERAGRIDDAIDSYRTAIELVPDGQAAGVALGRALLVTGRREAAAEVAIRLLGRGSPESFGSEPDPWWTYRRGLLSPLDLGLARMREAVRR
jgi:tetratricopeptide (TPR) repeat protein